MEATMTKKMIQRVRVLCALRDGCAFRWVNFIHESHLSFVNRAAQLMAPDGRQGNTSYDATKKLLAAGLIDRGAEIPYPTDRELREAQMRILDGWWMQLTEDGRAAAALLPAVSMDELFPEKVTKTTAA
jgi:hypothetical protein